MPIVGSNILSGASGQAGAGVDVGTYTGKSLVFNSADSPFLSRTPAGAGNRKTWTKSVWVKRAAPDVVQSIMGAGTTADTNEFTDVYFGSDNKLSYYMYTGGSVVASGFTNRLFRDTSAWYHIVHAVDTTQSVAANRSKLYVNGEHITSFSSTNDYELNTDTHVNNTGLHLIGEYQGGGNHFNGYMAQAVLIDGAALTPSSFGETSADTGVWVMKDDLSGLTFGTNGFKLEFKETGTGTASTSTIGADTSGEDNHWTSNNFAATDSALPDTPVNNFCTLNPLSNHEIVLSDGNLKGTGTGSNWDGVTSTFAVSSGKWYWEVKALNVSEGEAWIAGIHQTGHQLKNNGLQWYSGSYVGQTYGVQDSDKKVTTGTQSSFTSSIATGDIVQFRLNLDDNELSVSVDGVDKGKLYDITNLDYSPAVNLYGTSSVIMNFGQDSSFLGTETATSNADGNGHGTFHSAVPTDYLSLCTANLPEIEIGQGGAGTLATDFFNTRLYTGTGSSLAVTGVGFSPDLVWLKSRATTDYQVMFDSIRGATKYLRTSATTSETTTAESLKTFDSDGFTLGTNSTWNASSMSGVSWNWLLGTAFTNAASTNGATIETVGQYNDDSKICCFTYTGNGSDDQKLFHPLGVVPDMIIIKQRNSGNGWFVYHSSNTSAPETDYLTLDTTDATSDHADIWSDDAPTSTLITVGTQNAVNGSSDTYVCYAFSGVNGFSSFGSYKGAGGTDGTYIHTGFPVAWIMTKRNDSADDWAIYDNTRNTSNVRTKYILANSDQAETTYSTALVDFLSTGAKWRGAVNFGNNSTGTYIYLAFSSGSGFKYSTAI